MSFLIIECSKCGTPQYIRKGQVTRICPKCHFHITCKNYEPLGKANSEIEAQKMVQAMKLPNELNVRMQHLHSQLSSSGKESSSPYFLFNNVITQLLGPFPNTIPLNLLMEKTQEVGLEDQFVENIFSHLEAEDLLLRSTDNRGNTIIKFPSLPLDADKIHIQRPDPKYQRRVHLTKPEEENETE